MNVSIEYISFPTLRNAIGDITKPIRLSYRTISGASRRMYANGSFRKHFLFDITQIPDLHKWRPVFVG